MQLFYAESQYYKLKYSNHIHLFLVYIDEKESKKFRFFYIIQYFRASFKVRKTSCLVKSPEF